MKSTKKLTYDEFIDRSRMVHGDKYDYSKVEYKNSSTKVCIICPEHGEFWQTPTKHMGGQGCPKCARNSVKDKEYFIDKSKEVHGDEYDYSKVNYVNLNKDVFIIHNECGNGFLQSPKNHLKGHGCPFCKGKRISKTETKTKESFIGEAVEIHGNKYDYSKVAYVNANEKVCIICPIHGEFWQTPNSHLNGSGCPKCGAIKSVEKRTAMYTTEEFIRRSRMVHNDKYVYTDKTEYITAKTPVCIICPEHGEFWQTPEKHLVGCGCPKCGGTQKLNTDDFVTKANDVHGHKYDYSKVKYVDSHTKVEIVCPTHGSFWQTPNEHLNGNGCPSCSHIVSRSEREVVEYIRNLSNLEIEPNTRDILPNNKELDIYLPQKKLAIEYNGMRWHSELYNKDKYYHLNKLEECNKLGIGLIQVFEYEYLTKKDLVLNKICHILGILETKEKVFARKCEIAEIDKKVGNEFLEKNHIQGGACSTVCLGCYYEGQLVGVMSFKREKKDSDKWELTRFATDITKSCFGVGGKVFKYFVRKYSPSEVKSFADRRWTIDPNDNLYIKMGFEFDGFTSPDYRYTKTQYDYIHKFNFRKERLHKKYGFPMTLTETQMADELGYYKIWDCGLIKYVWKNKESI